MAELCVHLILTSAGAAVSSIGRADWLSNPTYQTFSLRTLPDGLTAGSPDSHKTPPRPSCKLKT